MKINSRTFEGAAPELVLKTVFGYDSFRLNQKEIINQVLKSKDVLAVMPTGGGKSICYQIPALILEGITVVVSPLISLMQDQVSSLEASGIHSVFLNSSLAWEDYLKAVDEIKKGEVKIVYLSPEGLATSRIRELLTDKSVQVSLITVDEAHCISSWGHDFRQDYMEIKYIRRYLPDVTMLALTATATEQVRNDVIKNLELKEPAVFISSFNRSNIYLEVQPKRNGLEQVVNYIRKHSGESGIIYCYSRRQVDELTKNLDDMGYSVLNYHAGLTDEVRAKNQDLFIKDEVQIMVATVAFGMGIDKPNVRFVINYDLPKSIEEYYQEIGRAGRDGLQSSALLLYSTGDITKVRYFFDECADPQKAELLLQGMVRYAEARVCRRKTLLAYFGEIYKPEPDFNQEKCCCDVCSKGELPLADMTTPVQKLLCCIIRLNERFGANYVVDVLLGSRNKRILENNHNMLSTWGIGNELSKADWLELVSLLVAENFIRKEGEYNVLALCSRGREVLSTREKILLPFEITGNSSYADSAYGKSAYGKKGAGGGFGSSFDDGMKKAGGSAGSNPEFIIHKKAGGEKVIAEKPGADDAEAERIIADLKAWRKRKADDMNVPPYVVFNDKTLMDLAAKKPKSKGDLNKIYGLGKIKIENFGGSILSVING